VRRRLDRLEERLGAPEDHDTARTREVLKREVLKRMTVEELRRYVGALTRRRDGELPTEGGLAPKVAFDSKVQSPNLKYKRLRLLNR
jgi:hypothetical protein